MQPEIDRYAHLDSFLHRWDPRWKLASLAALLAGMGLVPPGAAEGGSRLDLSHALLCLAVSFTLVHLSRIPVGFAMARLWPAVPFLVLFVLVYPLGAVGQEAGVHGFPSYRDALPAAAAIAIRAVAMLLLVFPMFGTSRFDVTMKALRRLRVPGAFVQLVVFSYRYLYAYAGELGRVRTAARARGLSPRPVRRALRSWGYLLGMLLVRSVERTERIHQAMVARGYAGEFHVLDSFATRPLDMAKAAALSVLAAGLLGFRLLG